MHSVAVGSLQTTAPVKACPKRMAVMGVRVPPISIVVVSRHVPRGIAAVAGYFRGITLLFADHHIIAEKLSRRKTMGGQAEESAVVFRQGCVGRRHMEHRAIWLAGEPWFWEVTGLLRDAGDQ